MRRSVAPSVRSSGRPRNLLRTDDLPIAKVVGDGEVILSDEEILLIARDGTTRPIEHTAAPSKTRTARSRVL